MIHYKTQEEIELIRQSCLLVTKTHAHVASILKPGMTGLEIDKTAEEFIRDHGGIPAFKGYQGFPGTLCISPNDCVVHGIPSDKEFAETDILSIAFFGRESAMNWHLASAAKKNPRESCLSVGNGL